MSIFVFSYGINKLIKKTMKYLKKNTTVVPLNSLYKYTRNRECTFQLILKTFNVNNGICLSI